MGDSARTGQMHSRLETASAMRFHSKPATQAPGAAVGRSQGSPHPGHSGPSLGIGSVTVITQVNEPSSGSRRRRPAKPRDEEPVGPVSVRKQLDALVASEVAVLVEEPVDDVLALGAGDRADRIHERSARG